MARATGPLMALALTLIAAAALILAASAVRSGPPAAWSSGSTDPATTSLSTSPAPSIPVPVGTATPDRLATIDARLRRLEPTPRRVSPGGEWRPQTPPPTPNVSFPPTWPPCAVGMGAGTVCAWGPLAPAPLPTTTPTAAGERP